MTDSPLPHYGVVMWPYLSGGSSSSEHADKESDFRAQHGQSDTEGLTDEGGGKLPSTPTQDHPRHSRETSETTE